MNKLLRSTLLALLFGLPTIVVPLLAGLVIIHQERAPLLGIYVDGADPPTITQVMAGSSAAGAGLRVGDTVLAVDGLPYADFRDRHLGQAYTFTLRSGDRQTSLLVIMGTMLAANLGQLACAVFVALIFWGTGLLFLRRRFWQIDVRLLFLFLQSCAVAELIGLAYPRFWLPYSWMVSLEVAGLIWAAPLLLHHQITFPVVLGTPRQRIWLMASLYGLALPGTLDVYRRSTPWTSLAVFGAALVAMLAVAVTVFVYFRRATADGRRRLRVAIAGTIIGLVPPLVGYVIPSAINGYTPAIPRWLVSLFVAMIPLSYLYVAARHNLFGIDHLLNRATVYAILSLGIFALYLGPVLLLYQTVPNNWLLQASVLAALAMLTGLTFGATRSFVQRRVDQLFYGGWYDYPEVVEKVSAALARSRSWDDVAGILTNQVTALMQLEGAQLIVGQRSTVPLSPGRQAKLRFSIDCGGQASGDWVLAARRDQEDFSTADKRILQTLAREAEIALSSVLAIEGMRDQVAQIRASRATSIQLQRQLLRSREEERGRLARELHDGPIQTLIALKLQLGMLASGARAHERGRPASDAARAMCTDVSDLIGDLRQACTELRPPMLDTMGLGAALRALAEDWSSQWTATILLDLPADAPLRSVPEEVAVNFYRVAQEALANVAHHANAQQINLVLAWDAEQERLEMAIRDDGRGFANTAIEYLAAQGHFGLMGMRERMALIGGHWQVESEPGHGTAVLVSWRAEQRTALATPPAV